MQVYCLDFSLLLYKEIFGNKQNVLLDINFLKHTLIFRILEYKRKFGVRGEDEFFIAVDPKKAKVWRTKFFKENYQRFKSYQEQNLIDRKYKGKRAKDETLNWEEIFECVESVLDFFTEMTDFTVLKHPEAEADDIIFVTAISFPEITILGYDKDFNQIYNHNPYLKIYDIRKKKYRNPSPITLEEHILMGDAVDNILPCKPRLGEKTAMKMVQEGIEKHLSIDKNLKEHYEFNKILIDFSCIPIDIVNELKKIVKKPQRNFNASKIMQYLGENKLPALSTRIGDFKIKLLDQTNDIINMFGGK